jgi:hypothetical protein
VFVTQTFTAEISFSFSRCFLFINISNFDMCLYTQ